MGHVKQTNDSEHILNADSDHPVHAQVIATDKAFFFIPKILISFLFLHENICCGTH